MSIDRAALVARAFDAPSTLDVEDLRVHADELEQRGDPRGTLINLSLAEQTRETRAAVRALGVAIFGVPRFVARPRNIFLEWRAGALFGIRATVNWTGKDIALVDDLLASPEVHTLRRLWIRCRPSHVEDFLARILASRVRPPLAQLVVGGRPYPSVTDYDFVVAQRAAIEAAFPDLELFAPQCSTVRLGADPSSTARRDLVRCLWRGTERDAALARIVRRADAEDFFDIFELLLEPAMSGPVVAVLAAIGTLGERARPLLPKIAAITGDTAYVRQVCAAAGRVVRDLR